MAHLRLAFCGISLVVCMAFASAGPAAAIEIVNSSFEAPLLRAGVRHNIPSDGPIPGWSLYDPNGLFVAELPIADVGTFEEQLLDKSGHRFYARAPDGGAIAYTYMITHLGAEFGLQQALVEVITPNTRYTLEVMVGNTPSMDERVDYTGFPGYRVELLAGSIVVASDDNSLSIAEGDFEAVLLEYTASTGDPLSGQALTVRLVNLNRGDGIEVDFDTLTLEAETVPPADTPPPLLVAF